MIFISKNQGQFANQLFLFVSIIAIAEKSKRTIFNPIFNSELNRFTYFNGTSICYYPISAKRNKLRHITRLISYNFTYRILDLFKRIHFFYNSPFHSIINIGACNLNSTELLNLINRKKLIYFYGWPPYPTKSNSEFEVQIKNIFEFKFEYKNHVDKIINEFRKNAEMIIGIHIRQGDYKKFMDGKYYYITECYVNKMKEVQELFKDKKLFFIICSNEPQNIISNDLNYYISNNDKVVDLLLLSKCDYIIGPPSTFSMWASFYGNTPLFQIDEINEKVNLEKFKIINLN